MLLASGGNQYKAKVTVGIKADGSKTFYDVVEIEPTNFKMKEGLPSIASPENEFSNMPGSPSAADYITDKSNVKEQSSYSEPLRAELPTAGKSKHDT